MEAFETTIINGTLATGQGVFEADIGIKGGRISAISEWGSLTATGRIIDAGGKTIIPGGIDTHVHAADPGLDDLGIDFGSATHAAALGGVTTVVDMPMQLPPTTDAESFDQKMAAIAPKAFVDYALWATCKKDDLSGITPLKEKGVVGYKLVMQESVEGIMPYHNDGVICEALQAINRTGLATTIHAESQDQIMHLETKLRAEGRTDAKAFLECHPPLTELEAINRVLFLANYFGSRINIAHCSLAEGVDMIYEAKCKGQPVTVETCIHYLVLDNTIFDKKGVLAKLSPALRGRDNCERLWQQIREGKIDCVASDHVPFPLQFKAENVWEASAGIPGIQTMIPLLVYEGICNNRIELPHLVRVTSEGPARMCGLYPRKGSLQIGADADLALYDLERVSAIELADQVGLEWTLYDGLKAVCPDTVLVRGNPVVEKGTLVGEKGFGQYCSPD